VADPMKTDCFRALPKQSKNSRQRNSAKQPKNNRKRCETVLKTASETTETPPYREEGVSFRCFGDRADPGRPKRTSTPRVRKHRALKDALRDETREAELRIVCKDLGSISEWLIQTGELSAADAEKPGEISKALAAKIRKLSA
jgi:hypothetical protein